MAVCHRCAGISLEDGLLYALLNIGSMILSGCPGCNFFLEAARRHYVSVEDALETQVLLRRPNRDKNLVDVLFVKTDGSDVTVENKFQLRMCDAYGKISLISVARASQLKLGRSGDAFLGRLRGRGYYIPWKTRIWTLWR